MSFIAPTRSKKLKKLCLIAHSIIREWGWGYFYLYFTKRMER